MDCYYLTKEQYSMLNQIEKTIKNSELYNLLFDVDNQIIKLGIQDLKPIVCPQDGNEIVLDSSSDLEILITGHIYGYGGEIEWCHAVKKLEWIDLVETVMRTNPEYQFPNEQFGGRTSDSMFTALDLIGCCNICYCPDRIKAYHTLGMRLSNNPVKLLKQVLNDNEKPRELYCFRKSTKLIAKIDYSYYGYTDSFKKFLENYSHVSHKKNNPALHCLYINQDDEYDEYDEYE